MWIRYFVAIIKQFKLTSFHMVGQVVIDRVNFFSYLIETRCDDFLYITLSAYFVIIRMFNGLGKVRDL